MTSSTIDRYRRKVAALLLVVVVTGLNAWWEDRLLRTFDGPMGQSSGKKCSRQAPHPLYYGDVEAPHREYTKYQPGSAESYILENATELGYGSTDNPVTCSIWRDPDATTPEVFASLIAYSRDLENHTKAIDNFKPIPNLMDEIKRSGGGHGVCNATRLHPDGIQRLFPSNQLSFSSSGYIDALLPPMRDRKVCLGGGRGAVFSMDYLVHDFEAMCHKLKPTSKLVLVDMGASLDFHGSNQPIMWLLRLYEKFGFHFDHIYAFEIKGKDPKAVYGNMLPEKYFPSYHWINIGVTAEEGHKLNPLHSIVKTFDEDDFVVVKLDIDTSSIEVPLVKQLLNDTDGSYSKLIDQFYFEHHVHQKELARWWGQSMVGTVQQSLELFWGMRKKGIPAHFWT